ncbi:MAG: protein kinase [Gemmataceae bacterium]
MIATTPNHVGLTPRRSPGSSPSLTDGGRHYWATVARVGAQIADALAYAHTQGVLHRDIKPANLLLDLQGSVWVTDFGLAKSADADDLTHAGDVVGTLRYLAPERFEGAGDHRADVYALGLTLYELLTLRPAFVAENRAKLIESVVAANPPRPRTINPAIPRDLETIVLKATERNPAARYATAADLADDLRRWADGEPISARPSTAVERAVKWVRRKPALAAAGALLALVVALLAGVGGVAWMWRQADRARVTATNAVAALEVANRQTETAKDNLDHVLTLRRISLAQSAWRENDIVAAEQLLDECPPAHRQWEWLYVRRLCRSELLTLEGQAKEVRGVCFSPDGKWLATAGSDDTLKVWDVASGAVAQTIPAKHPGCICFSPDGRLLAAGLSPGVGVWEVATGRQILSAGNNIVRGVCFSPDGKRLATGDHEFTNPVKVWEVESGKQVLNPIGHGRLVMSVCYSPDGRYLASGSWDSTVKVWDAATGNEVYSFAGESRVACVRFSPSGDRLAASYGDYAGSGAIRVWDVATGREAITLRGHAKGVDGIQFSPDGRRIVSGSQDRSIKVWDVAGGKELRTYRGHTATVNGVSVSPDGRLLASAGADRTIKLWDMTADPEAAALKLPEVRYLHFSPDGRRLAATSSEATIRVWDAATNREVLVLRGHTTTVNGVCFSPDGRRLASASSDGTVKIWDAVEGKETATCGGYSGRVESVCFSPDGESVAAAGGIADGPTAGRPRDVPAAVVVWAARTGRELARLAGHAKGVRSVAFSPDGRFVAAGGEDGTARVWDVTAGTEVSTFRGERGTIRCVCFSPDGRSLAAADTPTLFSASGSPSDVRVWDLDSGTSVRVFRGHRDQVNNVTFFPDGRRLASCSRDGTVRLWDLATGQEAFVLKGHRTEVIGLSVSPDGRRIVSGDWGDSAVRIWDADEPTQDVRKTRLAALLRSAARWHLDEAVAALREKQRPAVVFHLQQITDATSEGAPFLNRRGHIYLALGQKDKALADFSAVVERTPHDPNAWRDRAKTYAALRRWDEATADYTKELELTPKDWTAWYERAGCHASAGRWAAAEADLQRAVELDANDFYDPKSRLALVRLTTGNTAGYRDACAALMQPQRGTIRTLQANQVVWTCVLAPGAVPDMGRLVKMSEFDAARYPKDHQILNTLGAALYRDGKFEEAVRRLNEAVTLHGKGGHALDWVFLAMASHRLGKSAVARDALATAERTWAARTADDPGPDWAERAEIAVLLNEARQTLAETPPEAKP